MKTKLRKSTRRVVSLLLCFMLVVTLFGTAIFQSAALDYNVTSSYTNGKYYTALKNVTLTGNRRTDIVNIARSQIGYMEGNNSSQLDGTTSNGSGNYTEYGRWYGLQDMWCAMFVSWCANLAGVNTSVVPKTASTVTGLNYFIKQGVAHTRASISAGNYTPIAGDIIFFKSGRNSAITNHIGIVTSFSGTTINTIEGNTSSATVSTNGGCVRAKSYSITNTYIVYVCRPNYDTDTTTTTNVDFDGSKYDYRSWPNADSRWGSRVIGSGSATVGSSSGITTAVVKLAIQAGIHTAVGYSVSDFVYTMNQNNGYTSAGAMYWDVAKTTAGFDGVEANLMSESDTGVSFESQKQQIINWILAGKHMALYVADSKGVKSWVAVDEAMTLSTGEIYIMDATTDLAANANVKAEDKYENLRRIAAFTGGQIAYELIGSDDYRIWRKIDSRWKDTALGNYKVYADNDQGKGDLIIASTKLAIQAGLKNPQLFDVNTAVTETKKGSNGGFSDSGNMYWADAAEALGFDSYNANLLASGTYSSTGYYDTIKNYINAGKHMVIFVNNTWVAVDEAQTLSKGEIWVWSSNIDAVANGEKTGDNIRKLSSIAASFTRVACFTGGKIKTSQEQLIYLPGTFNGWKENRPMTKRSDGKYEKTIYLPSGSYEFKIIDDGYWHGNQGTISNSNASDNSGYGWEFPGEDYGGNHNCTLTASGGYYTFVYAAGGYSDHPYHLVIKYSSTPPQQGEVDPVIDSGAEDYRKWNITDTRWANASLNKTNSATLSNATAGYGDLYAAGAKLMIFAGIATPETIDPGKLAAQTRVTSDTGVFDWDDFAKVSTLTKVNTELLKNGTYETRLGGRTAENTGKTLKQYILDNHYHLFIKIDDFSGGYGWALVDEAMTASATGDEIYVWLSKSTASKGTDDNPVLLSSISTTFKRVVAFSGGNNIVQTKFSGNNDSELTASYSYCGMTAEINSGDYVPYGAAVTVNAVPAAGYQFERWNHNLGSGDQNPTSTSNSLRYTATTAADITYYTSSKNGTITYSDEDHFTYISKTESAALGASVSFTISPEQSYRATVFVEDAGGNAVSTTSSNNTYTFTMPASDVSVSVEMNYEDYRTWSKSDTLWADTQLGSSSYKVSGTTAGMGDLVVAVTKLSIQSGSSVTDVNDAVSRLNSGGGLGTTGYLDWAGTVQSNVGFSSYHLYNSSGSSTAKAVDIIAGINAGKHYVIKVSNSIGWVAVDEKLTKLTGDIYVMCSGDNPDENADVKLSSLSATFANYAHFEGGTTPSVTTRTVTFTPSEHIGITASYSVGGNAYSISSGDSVPEGFTVRFRASAEPEYEFDKWTCNVTPDQMDTADLVVTVTQNITVSCSEKAKEQAVQNVPMRIKYCYNDYDPDKSETFEYLEGDEYLTQKTEYSGEFTLAKTDLNNSAVLAAKVVEKAPRLSSDYFNFVVSVADSYTSEFDYTVDSYVVEVNMTGRPVDYTVTVNNGAQKSYHFQEEIELKASDYGVSDAVWLRSGNNIVCVDNTYKFRVSGNMELTVREKESTDPASLVNKSVVVPAYSYLDTNNGTETSNQNFYIQNFVDTESTVIGAGVFYYLYNNTTGKPSKSAVTASLSHLEEYALGFAGKATGQSATHTYNNKSTGLSYSYINYYSDQNKEYRDQVLRTPYGTNYIHYFAELTMNNYTDKSNFYYRVYSFFIYSKNGVNHAVVTDNPASACIAITS